MRILNGTGLAIVLLTSLATGRVAGAEASSELWERSVRPLLERACWNCHSHSADRLRAGLFLDSRSGLLEGGDSGPAIVPGDIEVSLLIRAIRYQDPELQMPPRTKLDDAEIQLLEHWVAVGAPGPSVGGDAGNRGAGGGFDLERRRQEHWAWQPVARPELPRFQEPEWESWVKQPLDRFIAQGLKEAGLEPAPAADRRVWLRRLFMVLTGLPPSPDQVRAFQDDPRPDPEARSEWVRRLLGTPAFGERWARHWLDVVRYSETLGHEFDYDLANAWQYRDYVIRAFSQDIPYDHFVREHIAGDLLENPRRDPRTRLNESVMGTAFYWFSQQVHSPVDIKAQEVDLIENQIDTLTRGFQALTVSCARCHDHKFDAISTRDFYGLYGILKSSRFRQANLLAPADQMAQMFGLRKLRAVVVQSLLESEDRVLGVETDAAELSGRGVGAQATRSSPPSRPTSDDAGSPGFSETAGGELPLENWFREGMALMDPQVQPGDLVYLGPGQPAARVLRPFLTSRKYSRFFEGSLHSPTFPLNQRYLHVLVAGRGTRVRVIIENFHVIRAPIYGDIQKSVVSEDFQWMTFDLDMWQGRRAYVEVVDRVPASPGDTLAARFPEDGWFDLAQAVVSDKPTPPPAGVWVESVPYDAGAEEYLARMDELGRESRLDAWIPAMMDGDRVDQPVLIRGGPNRPGEPVGRRYLEALEIRESLDSVPGGSARRQLAEQIASPDNPLTARVWVNRVWHHLFGRGIVPTVDDFGVLGDRPSHPELLDWLADWFVHEAGWSTHRLIELLVTSATWSQSATPSDIAFEMSDPENRWFHKWPLRRIEAEAIRDSMLFLSGELDDTPFGPSVPVHLTEFMTGRGRPGKSGPLDGARRRSIYQEIRRNFMPPFLLAFDMPQVAQTFGRRTQSNVPAQSLILMNDPFVQQQARAWAQRVVAQVPGPFEQRLEWLFDQAFQRRPLADERQALHAYWVEQSDTDDNSLAVWESICHILFHSKELIHLN